MKFTLYEFALMARIEKLGLRYGLEPWQLGIEYDRETGETYMTGRPAGAEDGKRFSAMMEALGVAEGESIIPHEEGQDILQALELAIERAPRKWARG